MKPSSAGRSQTWWLALVLVVAGCSRSPSATPASDAGIAATDCDAIATRVTSLRLAKVPDTARQQMHLRIAKSCAEKDPSPEVRGCVVGARTLADLDRCGVDLDPERFVPPESEDGE